jgi:anthranilate phosphoribosyltransferase
MTDLTPLHSALQRIAQGLPLNQAESAAAFEVIMKGAATPAQAAALLMGLRARGETADEIAGAARALRAVMVRLPADVPEGVIDTCGTGGGRVSTVNLSTAAAFVVVGAGVPVAKHGNRSHTSRSGSADVLEALGIDINQPPDDAADALRSNGFTFMFAPHYHPAMRHLAPVRRELGVATIMNLVGPLVNPAGVKRQIVGVADAGRAPILAEALAALGTGHALVLHGAVGMDEISPAGSTYMWEVREGRIEAWQLDPGRFGLGCDDLDSLAGGDPVENASYIEELLVGKGTHAARCAVVLNAAAALYVSGNDWSFETAVDLSRQSLESGAAAAVLTRVRARAPAAAGKK